MKIGKLNSRETEMLFEMKLKHLSLEKNKKIAWINEAHLWAVYDWSFPLGISYFYKIGEPISSKSLLHNNDM